MLISKSFVTFNSKMISKRGEKKKFIASAVSGFQINTELCSLKHFI
jgi:hypothetical protein